MVLGSRDRESREEVSCKVIYVAGALFGPNDWEIRRNIHKAATIGYEVAKAGAYPFIPHTNTGSVFMGTMTPEFWYEGTLEVLRRCDAMILVPGWEESKGTIGELEEARVRLKIPVFERVDELKAWLDGRAGQCTRIGCSHGCDSACRGGPEL